MPGCCDDSVSAAVDLRVFSSMSPTRRSSIRAVASAPPHKHTQDCNFGLKTDQTPYAPNSTDVPV